MSNIWNRLIKVQQLFIDRFDKHGHEIIEPGMDQFNQPGWANHVWTSNRFRRAHLDVVDARDTRGLWMMHCCIFPHTDDPSPIFGYDVIAGRNKITGFFFDYSSIDNAEHDMSQWFAHEVSKLEWRKPRELPDWAKRIFSQHMVAAGNVSEGIELDQIEELAITCIDHYLSNVGETKGYVLDNTPAQNFYCDNQRQNPHTPKVMTSLGLNEDDVKSFIDKCLFPKII